MMQEPHSSQNQTVEEVSTSHLFVQFLDTSLAQVYDFAVRLFQSAEAEAALEAAMCAALEAAETVTSPEQIRTLVLSHLYQVARERGAADRTLAAPEPLSQLRPDVPQTLGMNLGRLIWEAAGQLPLEQYAALPLEERTAMSRPAIAETLGLSPTYTFVLLGRARHSFESVLATRLLLSEPRSECPVLAELRASDRDGEGTPAQSSGCRAIWLRAATSASGI